MQCYWDSSIYYRSDPNQYCKYVGIDEQRKLPYAAFPNPTSDVVNIEFERIPVEDILVVVYGPSGTMISDDYYKPKRSIKVKLDGFLGMYYIGMVVDGKDYSFKVVKTY